MPQYKVQIKKVEVYEAVIDVPEMKSIEKEIDMAETVANCLFDSDRDEYFTINPDSVRVNIADIKHISRSDNLIHLRS